jgi:beta-glucanase (GH16 family)
MLRAEGSAVPHRLIAAAALAALIAMIAPDSVGRSHASAPEPARSRTVPQGYVYVFGDEFDGTALDTAKWWTRYVYDGPQGPGTLDFLKDEQQRYRENRNHVVRDGVLNLVARAAPDGLYESGMIRSKTTIKYGYIEIRAQMPRAKGVFPAGWLNPAQAGDAPPVWPPEIDIFEFVHNGEEERPNMIHSGVVVGPDGAQDGSLLAWHASFNRQWSYWKAPYDFPDDFHVFAALWEEDAVTFFIDGQRIQKRAYRWVNPAGTPGFAHVLLNLAIGGSWAGKFGIDRDAFPQAFAVDYVRVYQREGQIMLGNDTRGNPELCRNPDDC